VTRLQPWSSEPAVATPIQSTTLSCSETRLGDHVEVTIVGDLDEANKDSLIATVAPLINEAPAHLVLNLTGVTFADSTGLVGLVRIRGMCDEAGCTLQLSHVGRFVFDLLTRTGLAAYLSASQSAADAL